MLIKQQKGERDYEHSIAAQQCADAETGDTIGAVTVPFTLTSPTPLWSGEAQTKDGAMTVESFGTTLAISVFTSGGNGG